MQAREQKIVQGDDVLVLVIAARIALVRGHEATVAGEAQSIENAGHKRRAAATRHR